MVFVFYSDVTLHTKAVSLSPVNSAVSDYAGPGKQVNSKFLKNMLSEQRRVGNQNGIKFNIVWHNTGATLSKKLWNL